MSREIIAGEYAKGLFILARNLKTNEAVLNELNNVLQIIEEHDRLMLVFKSPSVSKKDKVAIVDEITDKIKCSQLVKLFLVLLIEKNRFNLLKDMVESYEQFNDEYTGHENLIVESAVKLAHDEIEAIKKTFALITNKKIKLTSIVNDALIGGMKMAYRDNVFDASIKGSLESLKKDLMCG
jgi:F-type H+-transporting ATPase subunit delta